MLTPSTAAAGRGTCIVLGVETQIGLAIVRELGQAGVRVLAITNDKASIGAASRHAGHVVCVAALRSDETLRAIAALGASHGRCSLITVSEGLLCWLIDNRAALGPAVHPAVPPAAAFAIARDKERTLQAAAAVGIAVPHSSEPRDFAALQRCAATIRYPAVLKWSGRIDVGPLLARHGLEWLKAEYVHDAAELLAVGERYRPLGCFPLVQEYCAGQGFGQFFFMHDGQVVQRFQHLRVAEWPPEGGFSSVCDAVPLEQHRELQAKSVELLRSIGWAGVAMVEYRLEPNTGRAVLMEINGRFWGSFPLAFHADAGFAWLAHRAALGEPLAPMPAPRGRLRCRMVTTEIKRLLRIVVQPGRIQDRHFAVRPMHEILRFLTDFARPRVCYYVWSWDDPKPFFVDLRNGMAKLLNAMRPRLRRDLR